MWAIIGGSGFESFEEVETVEELSGLTPFGQASSGLRRIKVGEVDCLFLPRHGSNHERSPSEVNFAANIFALRQHGATRVISVSAVGSLRQEYAPGDLVVPTQYIDRTKGLRVSSFCSDGMVGHVSLAHPVCEEGVRHVRDLAEDMDFKIHFGKVYVCIEGPHFSTQAESNSYRAMGADIIGMTNFPEYALAREAGMCYLPCSFVTDYDCWDDAIPHVTLQEILDVMRANNQKAFALVRRLLQVEPDIHPPCADAGLKTGLMTPRDKLSPEQKRILQILRAD